MSREYLDTLKEYVTTLESKINTKEKFDKVEFRQRVAICKDLQGLVAKNFEDREYLEETEELLVDHIIPYISKMIIWEDNPVNAPKQMEVLKDMYRMAGRLSLKHFILYYEWDWGEKSKFFEPRQDILSGYCYYLQKIVLDPNFLNVLAMLPSGYGKCMRWDTEVFTESGKKMIKDIKVGDMVWSENSKVAELCPVVGTTKTYKKQVRIKTSSGREVHISPEHRMYTQRGYIQAKDLTIDDCFYTLNTTISGEKEINEDELIFLACMIFDGYCKRGKATYTDMPR